MSKCKELLEKLNKLDEKLVNGVVTKNNSLGDKPLELGFVKVGKDEIAFTPNTNFKGKASFKTLTVGSKVKIEVEKTLRGLHAKIIEL